MDPTGHLEGSPMTVEDRASDHPQPEPFGQAAELLCLAMRDCRLSQEPIAHLQPEYNTGYSPSCLGQLPPAPAVAVRGNELTDRAQCAGHGQRHRISQGAHQQSRSGL